MQSFKEYLTESKLPVPATQMEAAIVWGWENNRNKGSLKNPVLPKGTGISDKDWSIISKSPEALALGSKIAKNIQRQLKIPSSAKSIQLATGKYPLTKFWRQNGGTDATPKTDLKIGNYNFSLKMGDAQIISARRGESKATVAAAVSASKKELGNDPRIRKLFGLIRKFVTDEISHFGNVGTLKKLGTDEKINRVDKLHKLVLHTIKDLFQTSERFRIEFVREGAAGIRKFDNNDGTATHLLTANAQGNVFVKSVFDDSYMSILSKKVNPTITFKTTSIKAPSTVAKLKQQIPGTVDKPYKFSSAMRLLISLKDIEATNESNFSGIKLVEFRDTGKFNKMLADPKAQKQTQQMLAKVFKDMEKAEDDFEYFLDWMGIEEIDARV